MKETRVNKRLLALSTVKPYNSMAALRELCGVVTTATRTTRARTALVVIQPQARFLVR